MMPMACYTVPIRFATVLGHWRSNSSLRVRAATISGGAARARSVGRGRSGPLEKPNIRSFLCANSFPYSFVDIHVGPWIEKVRTWTWWWRHPSQPCELDEARRKIFYMQELWGSHLPDTTRHRYV